MFITVALVAAVAFWDEERESQSALEDFADEQAVLASVAAASLSNRLAGAVRDAAVIADQGLGPGASPSLTEPYTSVRLRLRDTPRVASGVSSHGFALSIPTKNGRVADLSVSTASLLGGLAGIERPDAVRLLVLPPGDGSFHTTDGQLVRNDSLCGALEAGRSSVRLSRDDAALLGLPHRTALAGLSRIDADVLGPWGVAVVASAERQRDRETRAGTRLFLGVLIAGGLVLGFGSAALRRQKGELVLQQELAVAEVLRERDERLLRSNRVATMGTMAMGLAHELSTPLGIIVGRAEQLLPRFASDDKAQRSLNIVLEQAERIDKIIRGLLGLARGGVPTFKQVPAADIVNGATSLIEHRYAKSGVTLAVDMPDDIPFVSCDLPLMEHALVNLLLNSCDACSPRGEVIVRVGRQAGGVVFTVEDDGHGITEADAARATEPFFTTKPVGKGTGLGLAIANEIVKSHRGNLSIGPRSPRGTRACLVLPRERNVEST